MTDSQPNIVEKVCAPRLNANEDEITIVDVCTTERQSVAPGQVLFVVESTKTTTDVVCGTAGFVHELGVKIDDQVAVGALLCQIADQAADAGHVPSKDPNDSAGLPTEIGPVIQPLLATVPTAPAAEPPKKQASPTLATLATNAAQMLASQHGFDISRLGLDRIVTERDVRAAINGPTSTPAPQTDIPPISVLSDVSESATPTTSSAESPVTVTFRNTIASPPQLVIFGAGTHASALIELITVSRPEIRIVAAVDDAPGRNGSIMGVPIVGSSDELPRLRENGVAYAGLGIGAATNPQLRVELFTRLIQHGFELPSFIHPRANVEPSVRMGVGNQIFAGATVGTNVVLGDNTLINCGCVISHDCEISSHVHITPGAILAGAVKVGTNSTIGMGCTVYLGTKIGANVIVGNGVHVFDEIKDGEFIRPKKTADRAA